MSRSTWGSRGRPSTRSPRMLCWISSVPPAIEVEGAWSVEWAMAPPWGASGPASIPAAPRMAGPRSRSMRVATDRASLVIELAGPAPLPAAASARARCWLMALTRDWT